MSDITKDELIKALKLIRMTCISFQTGENPQGCEECPLRLDSTTCALECQAPQYWKINCSLSWRAFI